jgi:hypothetical protein
MPYLFPDNSELTKAVADAEAREDFNATRYRGEPKPESTRQGELFERLHWTAEQQSLFGDE